MKYFIANWKAHKNFQEACEWADVFFGLIKGDKQVLDNLNNDKIKIIICPPYPFITAVKEKASGLKNIHLGAQNISSYDEGPFTGEVCGKNMTGLVTHVIIGHSERRNYFKESGEILAKKTELALKYQLQPIFCFENTDQTIPSSVNLVAYEPIFAIGTGKNETLENILKIKHSLPPNPSINFIYGGSVDQNNISGYLASSEIAGFLIASASLDPRNFFNIVSLA